MTTVLEIKQNRATLVTQARALLDAADAAKRGLTAEEEASYSAIMADVDKAQAEIERREKLEAEERSLAELTREAVKDESLAARSGEMPIEQRAMKSFLVGGMDGLTGAEKRALQADADVSGGFITVPQQFVNRLIKAIDDMVYLRQWGTPMPVTNAQSLGVPSLDADPADSTWTSELLIGSEDTTMAFGKRELTPKPLAKYIKVSRKLLRLNPDVEALVINRLAYKFGITYEKAGLTGSGANEPLGVFTANANGITTARDVSTGNTTTAFTVDGLINAKYSIKAAYWPRLKWLFHRDAVKMLAKLKDGDGQYIWHGSVVTGQPDMLLGAPMFISEYVPSTFTSQLYVGIVGDFSNFWYSDSLGFQVQRLEELYAATNQVGFIARMESDAMPVLAEAFARIKLA
jgi:HK97 family phage major capsid protein